MFARGHDCILLIRMVGNTHSSRADFILINSSMRLFDLIQPLTEGISPVLFHFINYSIAAKILKNNRFRLNISTPNASDDRFRPGVRKVNPWQYFMKKANGDADYNAGELSKAEVDILKRPGQNTDEPDYVKKYHSFMPTPADYDAEDKTRKFMPYYLATTRQRHGRYHEGSIAGVLFTLDGTKLGQRYKGSPVDYWENMGGDTDRRRESEDRIFSDKPYIENAAQYIIKIDILTSEDYKDNSKVITDLRTIYMTAKKLQIPTFIYDDRGAFMLGNKKKAIPFPMWKKKEKDRYWQHSRKDHLAPWLELYNKDGEKTLSKEAKTILYNLHWGDSGPGNDMHNARSDDERESYHQLLEIFRDEGIRSASEYKEMIFAKWIESVPQWIRLFKATSLSELSDFGKTRLRAMMRADDRYPIEDDFKTDITVAKRDTTSKWGKEYIDELKNIFKEHGVDHVGFIDIIRQRWAGKITMDDL